MYALGTVPLVNALSDIYVKQARHADDATACDQLMDVCHNWRDRLVSIGPDFGYFPNPSKTCLIVKECFYDTAVSLFRILVFVSPQKPNDILGLLWVLPPLLLPLLIGKFHCGSRNSSLYWIFQLHNLMQPMFMVLLAGGTIW